VSRSSNYVEFPALIYVTLFCALRHCHPIAGWVYLNMKMSKTNFLSDPIACGLWLLFFNHPLSSFNGSEYFGGNAKSPLNDISNNKSSKNYDKTTQHKQIKPMPTQAKLLEKSLLVIWNDRNADRRLEAMKDTYAPDVHFYEFDSTKAIIGYKAINELISKLQKDWPPESRFVLNAPSQVNHNIQFATWDLGPQGMKPILIGMDVAVIENDLIQSFYLFFDPPEKSK
jgi:hypothetical protein